MTSREPERNKTEGLLTSDQVEGLNSFVQARCAEEMASINEIANRAKSPEWVFAAIEDNVHEHVGQDSVVAAMLEHACNVDPLRVYRSVGCSGALVYTLTRAMVENPDARFTDRPYYTFMDWAVRCIAYQWNDHPLYDQGWKTDPVPLFPIQIGGSSFQP